MLVLSAPRPGVFEPGLGHLLPIRVLNDFIPIVVVKMTRGFVRWASSLTAIVFLILPQPFVFDFWP